MFDLGLASLPIITNAKTRSISAENPKGDVGSGGKAANYLGEGRKGSACISLKDGEIRTIAEIEGPGSIQHIWITFPDKINNLGYGYRDLILRMYWDGEESPSVETPIGDFFCNGFGMKKNINSLPIAVNSTGGLNCYIPMPFAKAAKITVENQHGADLPGFFYQVTYTLLDELPENAGYLHAQWRRENPTVKGKDFVILDGVKGKGQYIGTYLAWAALERHWWGEGEIKFYMDDDTQWPTICGTGTEDYVGGAWCFTHPVSNLPYTYQTPFLGYIYYQESSQMNTAFGHNIPMHGMYRWHIMDPIRFEKALKVTIQQIGYSGVLFERSDDISSVAYWYQKEPHTPFPQMLSKEARWPR